MKQDKIEKLMQFWLLFTVSITASALTLMVTGGLFGRRWVSADEAEMLERYERLEAVRSTLEEGYYHETDNEAMMEGAIRGMMASLDDPYTFYYTTDEMTAHKESIGGEYNGLGLRAQGNEQGQIEVIRVYSDGPAETAGLRAGDCIVAVNGIDVSAATQQDMDAAVAMLRGEVGEELSLSVMRGDEMLELKAVCGTVNITNVTHAMLQGGIGYIELFQFSGDDVDGFREALSQLQTEGARGLLIDLRDNPGGMIDDVVAIADELLGEGTIVSIEGRDGERQTYDSDVAHCDLPLAVLINGSSASASEILAAAVQDFDRGTVVGTRSFGKGIVQTLATFESDGAGLQYTSAEYFTPSGHNIHGVGVTPDVIIDGEHTNLSGIPDLKTDVQLKRAVEILTEEIEE